LPMTPPFGSQVLDEQARPPHLRDVRSAADTFDDGPTTRAPDEELLAARVIAPPPAAPPAPPRPKRRPQPAATPPPSGQQSSVRESPLATVQASPSPHNETMASQARPPAPPPPTAPPDQITLRPKLPSPAQEATLGANHKPPVS